MALFLITFVCQFMALVMHFVSNGFWFLTLPAWYYILKEHCRRNRVVVATQP